MRGLLEAATLVHDEHDIALALERVATVVAEALGFATVVINLRRREWDDFIVSTVVGTEAIRGSLLGSTYDASWWEPVLVDRFERQGTYFIPEGSFDWSMHTLGDRVIPVIQPTADENAWHPEDEIFVPFSSAAGELLGIFCVGEPASGLRPSDDELALLTTLAGYAGVAVDAAQSAAVAARQRRALEHLLRVSSGLRDSSSLDGLLAAVTDAIHEALGFGKVCVDLADAGGQLAPRASTGWTDAENAQRAHTPLTAFASLLDQEFEIEGCFLVPSEAARSRVAQTDHTYSSTQNGRGPEAWSNHWLLVPLYGRAGRPIGVIWADEPADRLLPTRQTLQALRTFANQAATAIESANDFAALHEISVARARLLEQEREQVAHLQELDTLKDEFIALVSHELRTPLTSIRGYTELLLDDHLPDEHRMFLDVIERNAARLLALVNDLLLLAAIQSGKLVLETAELDVDDLLADAAMTARPLAAAKEIELHVDSALGVRTLGDGSRLGQVLDNLLSNAIKFTPAGGTVRVGAALDGDHVCISVADSGIGIPQAEHGQMFERFFRSSSARAAAVPGTGLGLAITRGIVESHGGTIDFESAEGEGTTFRIRLAVAAEPADAATGGVPGHAVAA
ncbi:MAG TPA: GAF domain-containing sensor histidine kinase [Gaiellaceae bacterium]